MRTILETIKAPKEAIKWLNKSFDNIPTNPKNALELFMYIKQDYMHIP